MEITHTREKTCIIFCQSTRHQLVFAFLKNLDSFNSLARMSLAHVFISSALPCIPPSRKSKCLCDVHVCLVGSGGRPELKLDCTWILEGLCFEQMKNGSSNIWRAPWIELYSLIKYALSLSLSLSPGLSIKYKKDSLNCFIPTFTKRSSALHLSSLHLFVNQRPGRMKSGKGDWLFAWISTKPG